MDVERLKKGHTFTNEYFERQLQIIREIRLSERMFYQKVTDLYATAFDYDKDAATTRLFFKMVQNNVTVNKTEQAVLTLLGMHPNYTREQLADATSKTVRTMQRVLNSLRDKNLISREGSDKDGYWIVCSSVKK